MEVRHQRAVLALVLRSGRLEEVADLGGQKLEVASTLVTFAIPNFRARFKLLFRDYQGLTVPTIPEGNFPMK